LWHACKIKETADGGWGCVGRQTWTNQQILIKGRIEEHVQLHESSAAEGFRQNPPQVSPRQEATLVKN
jgi:hypothetical protein